MDEEIQLLANVVESSDDAIISKSLDGIITSWNKGAEHIYGYSAEEIIGKNISILAPPQLKDEVNQLINKIKDGKKVYHYDTFRITKDSKKVNVSISLSPIFDNSKNLIGISTIARDITKQKKSELALKESEEKYRSISLKIVWTLFYLQNLMVLFWMLILQVKNYLDTPKRK
ncbi:PAS domain S-box protein [Methanobacterium sp. SMA-27]|uniref:PAS domain-containing protein n=1 Tax=Methanobacterium sp. SMA-27 TaxID=1495336 RepID=UPI00064E37B7|nr:PAS domain S-box protein [Methanobacterium sp. SMA-27]